MKNWKTLESKTAYSSKYFNVKKDIVLLPDGSKKDWTYWSDEDAALMVAVTDKKELIMIHQYRYLTKKIQIEFPSGALNKKEKPDVAAKREFEEETGLKCKKIEKLGAYYESCSQFTRKNHMYLTFDVESGVKKHDRGSKGYEDIRKVNYIPIKKAENMVLNGKIESSPTALALLLAIKRIESKRK